MAIREIHYYNHDINQVRNEMRRTILDKGYEIVDHNPRAQTIVFKTKKSIFKWKSYQLTAKFTKQNGRVSAMIEGLAENNSPAASQIAKEILSKMDERLPVIVASKE